MKNTPKTYSRTSYATAGQPENPPDCISLKAYCQKYFLSKSQAIRLLHKKELCAVSFRKKIFIVDKPPEE